ncbi:MAG: hypothetical protein PG978_000045 [Wolbachia endosymbiont of Ctenocephalides felis wCfeF]|nr:MAG: hypothetical protein PG978_000045 [Wolbachia endosymbiont of Ctenocephalides felis wCfeF]
MPKSDDIQNGVSQNEITEETTEEPVVGNESGGEPPAEPAVENESGEEPSPEPTADTGETSVKSTVDEVKPTAELTLDNGSERKLPEKITTVNIEKPTEKVTTVNAGKPHVKFVVDEGNFPMKQVVDWGSKMKLLDECPCFNHHYNLRFKHCHDPYYNGHHTSCYHAHDSGNTVVIPYGWKGGLPMVKVGGHTEFFDLNKPVLISDLGCNICDCY